MRDHLADLKAAWAEEDDERTRLGEEADTAPVPKSKPRKSGSRLAERMDKEDLPRERLVRLGAEALSNAELVAILLSTGDREENVLDKSRSLLKERGLVGLLRSEVEELKQVSGLGVAKVTRIKAAVELAARGLADDEWPAREPFRSAEQVFERYRGLLGDLVHEEVWVLVLDQQHCLIREERLYKGMVHGASVRVAELLRPVIIHQGPAMIVVHNHPSGSPVPSRADREMTADLQAASSTMGIELLDHVIVTRSDHASMARLGLLNDEAPESRDVGEPDRPGYRA
ncbi:MAG: DNA repair protein RadC [Chloroflexota bacterium]|nr:DNA repair protein RadC [Chloroflexota bacterium]